jgi:hypothetical protein
MSPNLMPRKATPVRSTVRTGGTQMVCDYIRPDGSGCTCEGVKHTFVERVAVLRPLSRRNPAMAQALQNAGW